MSDPSQKEGPDEMSGLTDWVVWGRARLVGHHVAQLGSAAKDGPDHTNLGVDKVDVGHLARHEHSLKGRPGVKMVSPVVQSRSGEPKLTLLLSFKIPARDLKANDYRNEASGQVDTDQLSSGRALTEVEGSES